ncbi:MAG TPA: hypothetical protein VIV15_07265 [Anaerolineales bacterium]
MSQLYLMEKDGERMYVPPAKKDEYEKGGWKVIQPPSGNLPAGSEQAPVISEQLSVSAEQPDDEGEPAKGKRGKKS